MKKAVFHHENWKPGEEHGPSQKLDWKPTNQSGLYSTVKEAETPHGFYRHFPAEARMPSATLFHPRIKDPGRPDAEYYGGSDHPGYQEWRGTDDRTKAHAEHHNLTRHHGMSEADVDHVTRAYPDRKLEDFHGKHPPMVQAEIKRARDHFENISGEHELRGTHSLGDEDIKTLRTAWPNLGRFIDSHPEKVKADLLRAKEYASGFDKSLRKAQINEQEILSNPSVKRFVKLLGEKLFEASRPKLKVGDRIIHRFLGLGKVHSVLDPEHDDPRRGASFLIDFLDFTMACFQDEITPMEVPALQDRPLPIKANAQSVIPTAPPHPAIELTEGMRPHMSAVVEQQQAQEAAQLEAMQDGQAEGEGSDDAEEDGGSDDENPFVGKSSAEIVRDALLKIKKPYVEDPSARPLDWNGPFGESGRKYHWTQAQHKYDPKHRTARAAIHGAYTIRESPFSPTRVELTYSRNLTQGRTKETPTYFGYSDHASKHDSIDDAKRAAEEHHIRTHYGLKPHEVAAVHAAWPDEGPSRFLGKHPDHVKAEVRRALQAHNPDHPDLQKAKIDYVGRKHPPKGQLRDEDRPVASRVYSSRRNRRRINWENHWDELQTGHGGQSGGRDRPRTRFQPNPDLPGGRTIEDVGREGTPADELVEKGRVKTKNKAAKIAWEKSRRKGADPYAVPEHNQTARRDYRNITMVPQNRPPSGNPRRRFVGDYSDRNFPLTETGGLTQIEGRNEARTRLGFTRRMPTKTIPGGHPSKDAHFGVPADELVEKAKIDSWRHGKTGRIREGLPLTTAQRGKISDRQRRQYVRANRRGDPSRMGWDAPANSWQSDNVDPLTIPVPNRPIGNNVRQRRIKPNLPKGHDRSHPDYIGTNVEKARQEEIASPEERVRVRNRRVSDHYVPGATGMETTEFRRRLQDNWRGRGKYVGPDGHAVSPTSGYYGRDQFDGYSRVGERTVTGPKPGQLPKGKVSGTYPEEADVVKAKIDEARHGKTGRLTTATEPESHAITNKRVDRWRRRDDRRSWFENGADPMTGRSTLNTLLMSPAETQRQRLRHSRAAKPTGTLPKGRVSGTYPDEPHDVLKSALDRLEKKREPNPKADAESEKIKVNREKPQNKVRHAFKAAEWTHPNGHPRCIRCGQEECISGYCFDTKGNIDRAMSEYRSDMEKARVDEGLSSEEKISQRERRHYRLGLRGHPDLSPERGRVAHDPLREREFVPGGNLRQWSRWRRGEVARTKPKLPKGHDRSNPEYSGTNAAD